MTVEYRMEEWVENARERPGHFEFFVLGTG